MCMFKYRGLYTSPIQGSSLGLPTTHGFGSPDFVLCLRYFMYPVMFICFIIKKYWHWKLEHAPHFPEGRIQSTCNAPSCSRFLIKGSQGHSLEVLIKSTALSTASVCKSGLVFLTPTMSRSFQPSHSVQLCSQNLALSSVQFLYTVHTHTRLSLDSVSWHSSSSSANNN